MAGNGGFLPFVEAEDAVRPVSCVCAVDKSVHMCDAFPALVVFLIPLMLGTAPFVTEEVVQQGGPRNGTDPFFRHMEFLRQFISAFCGVYGVHIQGIFSAVVLNVLKLDKKRMIDNILGYFLKAQWGSLRSESFTMSILSHI